MAKQRQVVDARSEVPVLLAQDLIYSFAQQDKMGGRPPTDCLFPKPLEWAESTSRFSRVSIGMRLGRRL